MNRQLVFTALAGVVGGLGTGLSIGYVIAKKQLEKEFEGELKAQVELAKRHYRKTYKQGEFESPVTVAQALLNEAPAVDVAIAAMKAYGGDLQDKQAPTTENAEVVVRNIFSDGPPPPSEVDENEPHLITEEEFFSNPNEYEQYSMVFYMGDKVLIDDREQPVEDHKVDSTVGKNNLEAFTKLPEDEHIIYVRNNTLRCEFEIAKHEGNYAVEVLGLRS